MACKLKFPYSFWKLQVLRVPMSDLFNFLCLLIHWNIHLVSSAIHQLMKTEKKTQQKKTETKNKQTKTTTNDKMIIKNRKKGEKRVWGNRRSPGSKTSQLSVGRGTVRG